MARPCQLMLVRPRAHGVFDLHDAEGNLWRVARSAWWPLPMESYQLYHDELERPLQRVRGFGREYWIDRAYRRAGGKVMYASEVKGRRYGCGGCGKSKA